MKHHNEHEINIEATQLLPEIRPRWWPALIGLPLSVLFIVAALLLPMRATTTATLETVTGSQCVFRVAEGAQSHGDIPRVQHAEFTSANDRAEVSNCKLTHSEVGEPIEISTVTSLAELLRDALIPEEGKA